jgi:hypothetical protein
MVVAQVAKLAETTRMALVAEIKIVVAAEIVRTKLATRLRATLSQLMVVANTSVQPHLARATAPELAAEVQLTNTVFFAKHVHDSVRVPVTETMLSL